MFSEKHIRELGNERSCVFCSSFQIREYIALFSFFEANGPNQLFSHGYAKSSIFRAIFSTTLVTKVRVFLGLITMFRKKFHRLIFLKRMVSIIYLGNGVAKSCVFRKTFSTTLVTKVRVFFVLLSKFANK